MYLSEAHRRGHSPLLPGTGTVDPAFRDASAARSNSALTVRRVLG